MKEKWYWGICSLFVILLRLISSEDKTPLGYMCERNSQCMSDCCDVSECKESSKCNKIFGLWTIIGIVVLLIIVILVTVWIVAACCGYCTCILCCLKEKFRRRREKKDSEVEQEAARSTDIPLGDTEIRFMDPEEEERYRLQLALSYPSKQPQYMPPDRMAQLSQFTIESVALQSRNGATETRTAKIEEEQERAVNVSIDVPL